MRRPRRMTPRRPLRRRAFSLIEAVISTVIVGGLMVVALNTVGASKARQYNTRQRCLGRHLAQGLMAEILPLAYEEPVDTPLFGAEPSENTGCRTIYDDVDDYHQWSASPPQNKDGTAMANLTGWRRQADVRYTEQDEFGSPVGADRGVKRISVEVSYNDVPVVTLWAVRTRNDQQALDD